MNRVLVALALVCSINSAVAAQTYLIDSKLQEGSETLGTSSVEVVAGTPTVVPIGNAYDVTFLAEPRAQDTVLISTEFTIAGDTRYPVMLMKLDVESSISIGDTTLTLTVSRLEND